MKHRIGLTSLALAAILLVWRPAFGQTDPTVQPLPGDVPLELPEFLPEEEP